MEAMNDVRRMAQQKYNFSMLKRDVFLSVNAAGASWLTCKATPASDGTDVIMKLMERAWAFSTSGSVYSRTNQIDIAVDGDFGRYLPIIQGYEGEVRNSTPVLRQFLYTRGTDLVYNGVTDATWVMLTGIQELPDLVSGDTTDFFTTHFPNWLLLAVLQNLNSFLKDDQRVAISNSAVEHAWGAVTERDAQAAVMGQWTNLD